MTENNGFLMSMLDTMTHALERASVAETFLEAIFTYVSNESYPDKKTILELASMGTYKVITKADPAKVTLYADTQQSDTQEVDDGK